MQDKSGTSSRKRMPSAAQVVSLVLSWRPDQERTRLPAGTGEVTTQNIRKILNLISQLQRKTVLSAKPSLHAL
jgi:hypothetical protein